MWDNCPFPEKVPGLSQSQPMGNVLACGMHSSYSYILGNVYMTSHPTTCIQGLTVVGCWPLAFHISWLILTLWLHGVPLSWPIITRVKVQLKMIRSPPIYLRRHTPTALAMGVAASWIEWAKNNGGIDSQSSHSPTPPSPFSPSPWHMV